MEQKLSIKGFLDAEGKIIQLPTNHKKRCVLLEYLAEKFNFDRIYTEREVNEICNMWNTFGDFFVLRRELVDNGFLCRERDGSRYWKNKMSKITF